jgi:sulfur carrier protein
MEITIELNGEPRTLPRDTTLEALIAELGLRPESVAVELNRELVTRARRGLTLLADGDRLEIVTLVGGG